jgi:trk system potassium uptake protein TrkH
MLLVTFLGLCVGGTLLLILPGATRESSINLVDAVFTSVSAVCVTGLIVLDTPQDFTFFGQCAILLLIQLGGLGIMSIGTVALHAMGRRLSLKQERLLSSMTDTDHESLLRSLANILKFTFTAEGVGAALLSAAFLLRGEPLFQALWRGIFTAVSAFCNAGFALQSDSLVSYNENFFILHVVGALIIFGGLAPATSLLIPRWLRGKSIPLQASIPLITTLVLLASGTFLILAFEWNGILEGLSWINKLHNAWFQSVTLRTAGFNSVDIAQIGGPTFLVMILFMFIGGSPGGTAGGIKTTTLGVLALTFQANIVGKNEIVVQNRRIRSSTIFRGITILFAGAILWIIMIMMLETTQQISSRDLIFEATSALGTVGLSTGATAFLDQIGKVIVILTMFAGRIGPMTLFMLLQEEQPSSASSCPDAKISLT